MKKIAFILTLYAACAVADEKSCLLCGTWKSNAELTLENLHNANPPLVKRAREILEKKIPWGKLTIEYTATDARSWTEGVETPETVAWEPYEIMSSSGDSVTVRETFHGKEKMTTHFATDNSSRFFHFLFEQAVACFPHDRLTPGCFNGFRKGLGTFNLKNYFLTFLLL